MKDTLNLWGFEVRTAGQKVVRTLIKDGEEVLFLGNAMDARSMATHYLAELALVDQSATIRPVPREQVGPRAIHQMARVGMEREQWKAVARYMAWRMAELTARTALELNPNLPAIATRILEEARMGAMEELEKAKAKRAGVVGVDGKPAR